MQSSQSSRPAHFFVVGLEDTQVRHFHLPRPEKLEERRRLFLSAWGNKLLVRRHLGKALGLSVGLAGIVATSLLSDRSSSGLLYEFSFRFSGVWLVGTAAWFFCGLACWSGYEQFYDVVLRPRFARKLRPKFARDPALRASLNRYEIDAHHRANLIREVLSKPASAT